MQEWTIMLYANGHNELEPENWATVEQFTRMSSHPEVTITMQVARETRGLVTLIRSSIDHAKYAPEWSGVRRFVLENNRMEHQLISPDLNMADPVQLYQYIVWSIRSYPAKRYLLILGGHIYQFVGMLPDFSQDQPYFMGFPELSTAINRACKESGATLEALILDTCYASTIENLYEFGREPDPSVRYLLTYFGSGPLAGFPYEACMESMMLEPHMPTVEIFESFINKCMLKYHNHQVVLYRIDHLQLSMAKHLFSMLAYQYLSEQHTIERQLSPLDLLQATDPHSTGHPLRAMISSCCESLILIRHFTAEQSLMPLHVLHTRIPDERRRDLYKRLSFSKKNYWTHLICQMALEEVYDAEELRLAPLPMTRPILDTFISSSLTNLSEQQQQTIIADLVSYKRWFAT
ncbi:clostripain-related cysteine peptidase [Paenibacillus sp. strain BS8-2]